MEIFRASSRYQRTFTCLAISPLFNIVGNRWSIAATNECSPATSPGDGVRRACSTQAQAVAVPDLPAPKRSSLSFRWRSAVVPRRTSLAVAIQQADTPPMPARALSGATRAASAAYSRHRAWSGGGERRRTIRNFEPSSGLLSLRWWSSAGNATDKLQLALPCSR